MGTDEFEQDSEPTNNGEGFKFWSGDFLTIGDSDYEFRFPDEFSLQLWAYDINTELQ